MKNSLLHAAPGFDDPLGLLRACHTRIRQRCTLLDRIIEHIEKEGADEQVRQACRQVLNYFRTSGKQHHQDEECDLFPALLEACDADKREAFQDVVDSLQADHHVMAQAWDALEPALQALEGGAAQTLDPKLVERFQTLYLPHIDREEIAAFDAAAQCLDAAALERIGRAMAARRNAAYPLG